MTFAAHKDGKELPCMSSRRSLMRFSRHASQVSVRNFRRNAKREEVSFTADLFDKYDNAIEGSDAINGLYRRGS